MFVFFFSFSSFLTSFAYLFFSFRLSYGVYSRQGVHHENEDTYCVKSKLLDKNIHGISFFSFFLFLLFTTVFSLGPRITFAGIYDGHGGSMCSEYVKNVLHKNIARELELDEDGCMFFHFHFPLTFF